MISRRSCSPSWEGGRLAARSPADKAAVAVYAVGVSALYATSACYHRVDWAPPSRRRMRRLDHSMILVAIASTYTPIAVVGLLRLPPASCSVWSGAWRWRACSSAIYGSARRRGSWALSTLASVGRPRRYRPVCGRGSGPRRSRCWWPAGWCTPRGVGPAPPLAGPGAGRVRLPRGVPCSRAIGRTVVLHRRHPGRHPGLRCGASVTGYLGAIRPEPHFPSPKAA